MTNKDKYLKDEVDIKDIENDFKMYLDGRLPYTDVTDWVKLRQFLLEPVKPTLTEDEKVILRNIDTKNFYLIGRINDFLYLKGDSCYGFEDGKDKDVFWYLYHNLFHFIQNGEEYKISDLLED